MGPRLKPEHLIIDNLGEAKCRYLVAASRNLVKCDLSAAARLAVIILVWILLFILFFIPRLRI
jgi:hypothetical protein